MYCFSFLIAVQYDSRHSPVLTTANEFENKSHSETHQTFSVPTAPEELENKSHSETHQTFSVPTAPEELENKSHSETHQMFSVHTTPNEFENKSHSETHQFVFEETLRQRNDAIIATLSFSKSSVIKMFSVH